MGEGKTNTPSLMTAGNMLTAARLVLLPVIVVGITRNLGYLTVAAMAASSVGCAVKLRKMA